MKKVSFDFDGTLEKEEVQQYAKELVNRGIEVWITTTRFQDTRRYAMKCSNKDLYNVAKEVGIIPERIQFTNMEWKAPTLIKSGFIWHLDDNETEFEMLARGCPHLFIHVDLPGWEQLCNIILLRS